jgi:xanthine dehydrogenase accessory factor
MAGVYDIAEQIEQWLAGGREVRVATVVTARGLSSRRPAASAAWTDGEAAVGELLQGVTTDDLDHPGLLEITISDEDALRAGLACGGSATVLVQQAAGLPAELWDRLIAREPVCLVITARDGGAVLLTPETSRAAHGFSDDVSRLFARGVTSAALIDDAVVLALWPVPELVVMGDGLIADALRDAGALLGWQVQVTPEVRAAVAAVGELKPSDAVVVLSHDRAADGPTLAAAVAGRVGYVGALGSRRTQLARLEWLTEHGVPAAAQARIHGPAGLDIGAHTPGEIAVSIVAEILARRADASGGALRDRPGPVHVAGVQAPPPRYPPA